MNIRQQMFQELKEREIFEQAQTLAYSYLENIQQMDVFPSEKNLKNLEHFEENLQEESLNAKAILQQLGQYGSPATTAITGGRYFGFVNGGIIPVSLATKWLTDFWDQNGGLYLTSPINARLEAICEKWLVDLFNLPEETVAGFVSGTSTANMCGMVAGRFRLLKNLGWDVNAKGLTGAPPLRVIAHNQVHSSIAKALALIGFGRENIEWIESDDQGRMQVDKLPELDNSCLVILQAGNVNTGNFDHFSSICDQANQVGAWVHVDGAFGLWAAATQSFSYLTNGMEKASSWAVDGHKTLNTPYDCGIVLCRDSQAMVSALQATGEYFTYGEHREPMMYTPEMSKRSRAIELWATLKYLGKSGIDELVTGFYQRAKQLEKALNAHGFLILNEVVFNQVLIACDHPELTKETLRLIQKSGECWCGGSIWNKKPAIRMSICSWATTETDINQTVDVFVKSREVAKQNLAAPENESSQIL